ncbi:hypothetical protein Desor_5222 [Desulfosporosinus orientis DSM 765]|uniref:Uncharacterized protein n=1 Tax=Desulfosporosinus orientis (strain ATCC 19365 / DSM 765 / NCIMB 8382 / VKM B-1628 / Singapore I) TaxID=768706 RepID=G7W798_DESOD|nr:hypothetical protein Desor_5222 [Desulfosporosinus orientis DSM 765]
MLLIALSGGETLTQGERGRVILLGPALVAACDRDSLGLGETVENAIFFVSPYGKHGGVCCVKWGGFLVFTVRQELSPF